MDYIFTLLRDVLRIFVVLPRNVNFTNIYCIIGKFDLFIVLKLLFLMESAMNIYLHHYTNSK